MDSRANSYDFTSLSNTQNVFILNIFLFRISREHVLDIISCKSKIYYYFTC